jgi:transketolase
LLCERALDQIRGGVAYNNLNVKFAANYGGLSDSYDGASHHSVSDLAIIRSIPNICLINISDAVCIKKMLSQIIYYNGPVYFRMCRAETPIIHGEDDKFEIGKANIIKAGADLTVIVTGVMLHRVIEAAKMLENDGISVNIIEIHTIKPIDKECIAKAAAATGAVLTVEEGNVLGGLGSAVCEIAAKEKSAFVDCVGINDCFAESGDYNKLLDKYGLSVNEIYQRGKELYNLKKGGL